MKLVVVAVGGLLLCSFAHAQQPEPKPDMDKLLDKLTFAKDKASLPYRLLKPDGYDKDGKDRYPLVVFLHGAVGRGTDNKKQLRSGVEEFVKDQARKKHPCFLAVRSARPTICGSMSARMTRGATYRSPRAPPTLRLLFSTCLKPFATSTASTRVAST